MEEYSRISSLNSREHILFGKICVFVQHVIFRRFIRNLQGELTVRCHISQCARFLFRYLSMDDTCPMCTSKIDGSRIIRMDNGAAVDHFLEQSSDMS